jgi:glycosyltransferase involved in cell wall biosynthesis
MNMNHSNKMGISVLVPTYRRSKDLARCLEALKQQTNPADELLIVVRDTDEETHDFLRGFAAGDLPLKVVNVTAPGQVAALNAGLLAAAGDIIAITDDDAAPHPDWLERIQGHFLADETIGAVGGRDWVYENGNSQPLSVDRFVTVGKLQWFGRAIGNHHIGSGGAREVDILKGANMSYRRSAIDGLQFDVRLKGKGAQVSNDMGFSLAVRKRCWKVIYDPIVVVDHYPAWRFDADRRDQFSFDAYYNAAYNETLIMAGHLAKINFVAYLLWSMLMGTRGCFGVLQMIRFVSSERGLAVRKWRAATWGHLQAVIDCVRFGSALSPALSLRAREQDSGSPSPQGEGVRG